MCGGSANSFWSVNLNVLLFVCGCPWVGKPILHCYLQCIWQCPTVALGSESRLYVVIYLLCYGQKRVRRKSEAVRREGGFCVHGPLPSPPASPSHQRGLFPSPGAGKERGEKGRARVGVRGWRGQRAGAHVHPPLPFWLLLTFFWLASDHNIVNFCRKSAFRPLCYKEVAFYHEGPKKSEENQKKNQKRKNFKQTHVANLSWGS